MGTGIIDVIKVRSEYLFGMHPFKLYTFYDRESDGIALRGEDGMLSAKEMLEVARGIERFVSSRGIDNIDRQIQMAREHLAIRERYKKPHIEPKRQPGYVYFLRGDKYVKIGFSKNPDARARDIGSYVPHGVTTLHVISVDDMPSAESWLHRHFEDKRIKGEWFNLSDADIETIQQGFYDDTVKSL